MSTQTQAKILFDNKGSSKKITTPSERPLDLRYRPPVAKIDLEQALNFIELNTVGPDFCYQHFTSLRLPYLQGSRPALEKIAFSLYDPDLPAIEQMKRFSRWIRDQLPHAEVYELRFKKHLATNRGLSEEDLIQSGYGWCNEQARVLCSLTQVIGIPSRLVFGQDHNDNGHVMTEIHSPAGWALVDQTVDMVFERNGNPVSAHEALYLEENLSYFSPIHKAQKLKVIGKAIGFGSGDPALALGCNVGFHNHFVL